MKKSEIIDRKFVETIELKDYEILTDNGYQDVVSLHKTIPYLKYNIKTKNGLELNCADKHIVFNDKMEEQFVDELSIGDYIITENGIDEVIDIVNTNNYENMYDFELGDNTNHRYYTNGILSHNTFLVQTIAKMLGVPLFIQDCTKLTESGYVGEDVENCVGGLLRACDYDVEKAEMGIVILDEVDKIAKTTKGNMSITRDVGGEGVQQGLLKIVEGSVVGVPPQGGRKHPEQKLVEVDTRNILFIALGAFPGIDKEIERRFNKTSVGFRNSSDTKTISNLTQDTILGKVKGDDLKNFGLIPEFVGRFPVITHTNPLKVEDMVRIITEPQNSLLKQYQKLMDMDNVELEFSDDAIRIIAEEALKCETGARGLRGIMEQILTDVMYEYAETEKNTKLKIDKMFVKKILGEKETLYRETA